MSFPELFPKDLSRSEWLFQASLFRAWSFPEYQDFAGSFLVRYPLLAELRFPAAVLQCQQVESRCFREVLQFQREASQCCPVAWRYFQVALQFRPVR